MLKSVKSTLLIDFVLFAHFHMLIDRADSGALAHARLMNQSGEDSTALPVFALSEMPHLRIDAHLAAIVCQYNNWIFFSIALVLHFYYFGILLKINAL